MKNIVIGIFCIHLFAFTATAQNKIENETIQNNTSDIQILEASCGQCNFNLPGKGCNLAIRIKGTAYYIDGTNIDDHGDAHASDGFCETVRMAHVKGEIINNRFKSEYFKLIPLAETKKEPIEK